MSEEAKLVTRLHGIHDSIAKAIGNPDRVWCRECGASRPIIAAQCFRTGWPKCCGYTMTIDRPCSSETAE